MSVGCPARMSIAETRCLCFVFIFQLPRAFSAFFIHVPCRASRVNLFERFYRGRAEKHWNGKISAFWKEESHSRNLPASGDLNQFGRNRNDLWRLATGFGFCYGVGFEIYCAFYALLDQLLRYFNTSSCSTTAVHPQSQAASRATASW